MILETNKSKIVHASAYIDALKSSGYKSTYNAIAEIVDNSIDADAKNIFIIGEQKQAPSPGGRIEKRIVSFAFLDDGNGMDFDTIKECLSIGYTTKKNKKGMGRFGVGLPQASVFVCNRVEVYSWQDGIQNCRKTYLDLNEIVRNDLNEIEIPLKCEVPEKYRKYLTWKQNGRSFNFLDHGTLIIWNDCTRIDHRKWQTCIGHMEADLGRKYRYFLSNSDVRIAMCEYTSSDFKYILPNDPLYLMTPSQECLKKDIIESGYCSKPFDANSGYTECMFEIFKADEDAPDIVEKEVKYEKGNEIKCGIIRIKYSCPKVKYYSKRNLKREEKPGQLTYGSTPKIKNNVGISIVREGREIDFGTFGFFDIYNAPELRWVGCEISFSSELDDLFGVSNNKQYVDLKPMSKEEMKEHLKDEIRPLWQNLHEEIVPTIKAIESRNKKIRTEENEDTDASSNVGDYVNDAENHPANPNSSIDGSPINEEIQQEATEELQSEGIENPTEKQILQYMTSNVRIKVEERGKTDNFMTYKMVAGVLIIVLNSNHDFYNLFVSKVIDTFEERITFELLLAALMKSMQEIEGAYPDMVDVLHKSINDKLFSYMRAYKKKADLASNI